MERLTNYMRGSVRVRVRCKYPERFVNICANGGVEFWDMERQEDDIVFTTHRRDYGYIKSRAKSGGYTVIGVKKSGTAFFLWRLRKRYILLAGVTLCAALMWLSGLFIWEITVTGNETVPTSEILSHLRQLGVEIGTFRLTLDEDYISNKMLIEIPELCWLTVNTQGSRAEVKVREEIRKPEMVESDVPTELYATKAGIIEEMNIYDGKTLSAVGDTVSAGDVLVSGQMDSLTSGTRYVHAMGEVTARTWYTKSAMLGDTVTAKQYTGETKRQFALIIGERRLNLYLDSGIGWDNYDKTAKIHRLTIFGTVLPVALTEDTYSRYTEKQVKLEGVEEGLKARLTKSIENELSEGEIVRTEFEATTENGVVKVTITAECLERIDAIRRIAVGEE